MATSVSYSPSPFLPGPDLVERQSGWSARGSRPRWSDRWNSEKRKRRRASTHTKQCSPKAKAPRCRRTARHEKSKHRNVNYCAFFSLVSFFPSCALLFAGLANERRFPPSENGIEWTALSPRHSFPQPRYCCLCLIAAAFTLVSTEFESSVAVFRAAFVSGFCGYSSREQWGDNNNIALPLTTLFSVLRSGEAPVLFPPVLPGYCIKLVPSVLVRFYVSLIKIKPHCCVASLLKTSIYTRFEQVQADSHRPIFLAKVLVAIVQRACARLLSPGVRLLVGFSIVIYCSVKGNPDLSLAPCRLALYVYEYLLHIGAQKSAQTFLSEVCRTHGESSSTLRRF